MDLKSIVRTAAVQKDIGGVMKLKEHCGLSYERTVRVWNGSQDAKLKDVVTIMSSLGKELKFVCAGE